MQLYFSTNAIPAAEFEKVLSYLEPFEGKLGIELFPEFDKEGYAQAVDACMDALKKYPASLHGPYYGSDFSYKAGTKEFEKSMDLLEKSLECGQRLNAKYMVYHHSNRTFQPNEKEEMLKNARENYPLIKEKCEKYNVPIVVENAGVACIDTMLLDEEEFIAECKRLSCDVLIDIGHAHANGWNLSHVMEELQDVIISYHVHNNDRTCDGHQRIFNGTLDFKKFMQDYDRFTPDADIVVESCPKAAEDMEGVFSDVRYLLEHQA